MIWLDSLYLPIRNGFLSTFQRVLSVKYKLKALISCFDLWGVARVHLTYSLSSPGPITVWFDVRSTETHINKVCSCGFYYLHNLRRIRKYLSQDCLVTLIHAFVTGRLDYCNSLIYGLTQWQISKLKRVQNAAARITLNFSKFWHITPALRHLHWLPVVKRIQFKILPPYISELKLSNPNLPTVSAQTTVLCCYLLHRKCCLHSLGALSLAAAASALWN